MTYQKPLRRAYEQDREKISKWKNSEFPKIAEEAARSRASIFFTDETNVRTDHHSGRTWASKGKTPTVERTGKKLRLNVIGASSRRGDFRFMIYDDKMNGKKFVYFLKRLMHQRRRPVVLITDSHPAHRSRLVSEYVATQKGKLKLFFCQPMPLN